MHDITHPSSGPGIEGSRSIIFELLRSRRYVDDCSGGPDVNGTLHHFFRYTIKTTTFYTLISPN